MRPRHRHAKESLAHKLARIGGVLLELLVRLAQPERARSASRPRWRALRAGLVGPGALPGPSHSVGRDRSLPIRLIYQVRFANGDVESVETVRRARDQIRMRNVDSYPPQTVLPAEIRLNGDLSRSGIRLKR